MKRLAQGPYNMHISCTLKRTARIENISWAKFQYFFLMYRASIHGGRLQLILNYSNQLDILPWYRIRSLWDVCNLTFCFHSIRSSRSVRQSLTRTSIQRETSITISLFWFWITRLPAILPLIKSFQGISAQTKASVLLVGFVVLPMEIPRMKICMDSLLFASWQARRAGARGAHFLSRAFAPSPTFLQDTALQPRFVSMGYDGTNNSSDKRHFHPFWALLFFVSLKLLCVWCLRMELCIEYNHNNGRPYRFSGAVLFPVGVVIGFLLFYIWSLHSNCGIFVT